MKILQEIRDDDVPVHRISTADLCDMWGITSGMMTQLVRRGIAVRIGHGAFDLAASTHNYMTHLRAVAAGRGGEDDQLRLTKERARLASEQADAQALKNAALRGELVKAEDVERAWGDVLRQVRARILAVPSRLRQSLPLAPTDAEMIDRELRDALQEIGNADS